MKIHMQFTDSLSEVVSDKTAGERKANRQALTPSGVHESKDFSPLH